jgi:hypothetical protein
MRRVLTSVALGSLFALCCAWMVEAAEDDKPKHTIKDVMKVAHKEKLLDKIATGKGSKEEAKQLLELYQALGANKPPKGTAEGWKAKTIAIVEAAQEVVDDKAGAGAKLKKAVNCAQCHKEHKPA